jgi:cell division protein FtsQ
LNDKELKERLLSERVFDRNGSLFQLDLLKVERFVQKMEEVKSVRVYKKLGGDWFIEAWLRKPIARIFTEGGESCYLDSEGKTIRVTKLHTANVLVFSGKINEPIHGVDVHEIINNDSLKNIRKLDDFYRISNYVCNNPFLAPLIGQVYLDNNGEFVLIPLVGEQKIIFGSAHSNKQVEDKFKRLKIFYEEGMPFEGWKKYSEINVKYDGQIVCRRNNSGNN